MATTKKASSQVKESQWSDEQSVQDLWNEAAEEFEKICGHSLRGGKIQSFDDLQHKIEHTQKVAEKADETQKTKWDKAKDVGLVSLKCLKVLVGAAAQASSLIPFPQGAASIASNALCFVFDIPEAIKGYNDAITAVFSEVASALVQFKIYESMDKIDRLLLRQIHLVMTSFVRVCAHVVTYRQGRKRDRVLQKAKSIFDDDSGLSSEMAEFKRLLQSQRDVEGTITLSVALETKQGMVKLLENSAVLSDTAKDTRQAVQSLKEKADRDGTLINIRNILGVPETVHLDARTTQTCNKIADKCSDGTGSWIWEHEAYTAWTGPKLKESTTTANKNPYLLLLSGPSCSGKTSASALIVKRFEERSQREYVAHYFFPASGKKSDEDKRPVQTALKYMAFQIARVDAAVRKDLGKACNAAGLGSALRSSSSTMDSLWAELRIGTSSSGATYYLIFDGLENLLDKQAELLLKFALDPKVTGDSGRVRVLVSGTDDKFPSDPKVQCALRIQMEQYNERDMRIVIDNKLNDQQVLNDAKPGSAQQRARDKVMDKLPKTAKGSYSLLQFSLDDVIRLLSSRTASQKLDQLLDRSVNSHEVAIESLQRSLTSDEINDLNELLKWVLFAYDYMTVGQLEAVMYLCSGAEPLASLQHIISKKYITILKVEDNYVYEQDGVMEYMRKEKNTSVLPRKEQATISMTLTINNVDQEVCGHFFWDLAQKAIRENFKFNFDATSNSLKNSQAAIVVDEFESHHTIVTRAFDYLFQPHVELTNDIGEYLACFLPTHLGRLRELEDEEKGLLMQNARLSLGQSLYNLFQNEEVFVRHKECFESWKVWWTAEDMMHVQKWLMDPAVVRRLDKGWVKAVQRASSPPRGYLKPFVKIVVEKFLRGRHDSVENAYRWIENFIESDEEPLLQPAKVEPDGTPSSPSVPSENTPVDWDKVSNWCQKFMGLPDSDLNSLWYERLADAAFKKEQPPEVVESLYERALERENASWTCHRSFGDALFSHGRAPEAVTQLKLALSEIEVATPKAEPEDVVNLKLRLGDMTYAMDDFENAATYYTQACMSKDENQTEKGQFGLVKAVLSIPDEEKARKLLNEIVSSDAPTSLQHRRLISIIKLAARDEEYDFVLSRLLTVANADPPLLGHVVHALEMATTERSAAGNDGVSTEKRTAQEFAEDEARGVLLYYRGIAAYTYKIAPQGTEPISEALKLWELCRAQLEKIGGDRASTGRRRATEELAKHYFQSMVDCPHDENDDKYNQIQKLKELCDSSGADFDPPDGFLGSLYALNGETERSKDVLRHRVRRGLEILSDGDPENDYLGLLNIFWALAQHQDFENLAVALSLYGQPDLVTQELSLAAEDITTDQEGVERNGLLDLVTKLATETVQVAKSQFPQPAQQIERIQAAKAHINSLVAATNDKNNANVDTDAGAAGEAKSNTGLDAPKVALALLYSRLAPLEDTNTLNFNLNGRRWYCDGVRSDGKDCDHISSFDRDFYHCIYCPNRDFCAECLGRLRGITPPEDASSLSPSPHIPACSAKHRWFKIPADGADMYVGLPAANVRRPTAIRPVGDDESILEACYDQDDKERVTMEAWKTELARDWGISLGKSDIQHSQDGYAKGAGKFGEAGGGSTITRSTTL